MNNNYSWGLLSHSSEEDPHQYGIPEEKKFPLDSKQHVISAIKFFNYAAPKYKDALAMRIKKKLREYNIKSLSPSKENTFYNYYKPKKKDVIIT